MGHYHCACALFLLLPSFLNNAGPVYGGRVAMKIVEEPSNYGVGYQVGQEQSDNSLHMRVNPSKFSGPEHLRRLNGKCFEKTDDTYKFEFCPFANVTQHEQSLRWNPYHGVLGVWQEWVIENNTFVAMMMKEGDSCGVDVHRTVKVMLKCGESEEVGQVTEPATCHYEMMFKTPLVCHPHALLVYPTLSTDLQGKWDSLEGELNREEITKQGYNKRLRELFIEAGYYMSPEKQTAVALQAHLSETAAADKARGEFRSLPKCLEEYKKLKEEIEGLRTLLALNEGKTVTNKTKLHSAKKMSQIPSPVKSRSVEEGDINDIVIQDEDDDS